MATRALLELAPEAANAFHSSEGFVLLVPRGADPRLWSLPGTDAGVSVLMHMWLCCVPLPIPSTLQYGHCWTLNLCNSFFPAMRWAGSMFDQFCLIFY